MGLRFSYHRIKQELMALGWAISTYDCTLFLWHNEDGSVIGILVSHVDDLAFCGTE